MKLIDLSNNQNHVNFAKVKAGGVDGVWLKATEGISYNDPVFHDYYRRASAVGLRVGAYHFARPDHNGPLAEADHFCNVIGNVGRRDLRPVLDLERKCTEGWIREFNQRVKRNIGLIPMFYSYPAMIAGLSLSKPVGNGLWLASYGPNDGHMHPVSAPKPWKKVAAHQYTSNGYADGVMGKVDLSYASSVTAVLAHPVKGLL